MSGGPTTVLGIVCSPRKGGNTEILVREALAGAEEMQASTELITLGGKDIRFCDGCRACEKTGKCHIKDDMQAIYTKLLEANGLIFGCPVYFWTVTAQAKAFIDRTLGLFRNGLLKNKVGGVISIAGGGGQTEVRNTFYTYFAANRMIIADFVQGFAKDKGLIRVDRYACLASRELGKKVAAIAQSGCAYPDAVTNELRNIMKQKYGIDGQVRGRFDTSVIKPDTVLAQQKSSP